MKATSKSKPSSKTHTKSKTKAVAKSPKKSNNNVLLFALGTGLLLLVPYVAMQFSNDINWTLGDFIVAGTLLFGTGLIYEVLTRHNQNTKQHVAVGLALLVILSLVWVELAVGVLN